MRLKWHLAPDALAYDPRRVLSRWDTKVRLAGPYVVDIGTHLDERTAAGEYVGLLKLGRDGAFRLMEVLDARVAAGDVNTAASQAIAELAHRWPVEGIDADGLPWTAVDDKPGLQHANDVVAPAIDRSLGDPLRRACGGMDAGVLGVAHVRGH
jgi:choline kinase